MACWVAPAVAAEFWGVTLDDIWTRILNDSVAHKAESGFIFIDVGLPGSGRSVPRPPTYVAAAEFLAAGDSAPDLDALFGSPPEVVADADPPIATLAEGNGQDESDESRELPELDDVESASFGRLNWQDVREQVSRTRRPPPKLN